MSSAVSKDDFRQQLERILQSRLFVSNPDFARLLDYLAKKTLTGSEPKAWEIAADVYNRKNWIEDDPYVRVNLTRLRDLLTEYYAEEGCTDPVTFSVPERSRVIFAERNRESFPTLAQIDAHGPDLAAALAEFYSLPDQQVIRCAVTGKTEDIGWHHLDFDSYNDALCNMVPLCRRLLLHLREVGEQKTKTSLPELAPTRLADELAPKHFREWRVADAYACVALAFYLGGPRYGNEAESVRALRLCDAIHYARHRFFEPMMHQVIDRIALPFLRRPYSIERLSARRLTIQFTALLEETGNYDDAERALLFASQLMESAGGSRDEAGSRDAFTLSRRRAQLLAERSPHDRQFDDLLQRGQEDAGDSQDRALTLQVVRIQRWLRQNSPDALKRAHEVLVPLVETYSPLLFSDDKLVKPEQVAAADLSEIFLLSSIVYSRVQPPKWKGAAEEIIAKGKSLMYLGGHILPTEYGEFLSHNSPSANRLLQLSSSKVRPTLRVEAIDNIRTILECLERMLVLDTRS